MRNLLFLIFLSILSSGATGTIYIPTPMEDQLKDSYGVVRGTYQGSVFKKDRRGEVITEVSISLKETSGLKPGDVINKNNFKITFPGGVWQGVEHRYNGSPKFSKGEEVVLLINKGDNGFHLLNFGLGKYSLKREAGSLYLESQIFPLNSKISGIEYEKFRKMVEGNFGSPLKKFGGEKFVYIPNENLKKSISGRAPASLKEESQEPVKNSTAMFWLMLVLSVLGTTSYKVFNRRN